MEGLSEAGGPYPVVGSRPAFREVVVHVAPRPTADAIRGLSRPLVLVFMSSEARARWRHALRESDMRELYDFMFVA